MPALETRYVEWLEDKVLEMERCPNAPSAETLKQYERQVEFLRGVLEAGRINETVNSQAPVRLIPHGPTATGDPLVTQQIHQRTHVNTTNKLRSELFDLGGSSYEVRHRKESQSLLRDDLEEDLMTEEKRREKMVEDMMVMTREWKEQSLIAGKVIKKDVEGVESSSRIADVNASQLKVESSRLAEFASKTCNCWIWLMIIFICFTFISMVMFIKIFPKSVVIPTPTTPPPNISS